MLIAAMICMLVAVGALGVGLCFAKGNKVLFSLLSTFCLLALVCLGICVAAFKNEFSGFSILMIVSVCPLFLTINLPQKKNEELKNLSENDENSLKNAEKTEKSSKFGAFLAVYAQFVRGAAYLLSALAIAFCGLYIGKESGWAFAVGIAIGLLLTFLDSAIRKDWKGKAFKTQFLSYMEKFLIFTSVGLLLGAMLLSLIYSLAVANILFALGVLSYAAHILLQKYFTNPFNHLPYILAMLLLFASILL